MNEDKKNQKNDQYKKPYKSYQAYSSLSSVDSTAANRVYFSGDTQAAITFYHQLLKESIWGSEILSEVLKTAHNQRKSLQILKNQMPEAFLSEIRFSQQKNKWFLRVRNGLVATKLNMIKSMLLQRISQAHGFQPEIKIEVVPDERNWQNSGFLLADFHRGDVDLPSEEEAQKILTDFLKK